MASLRNNHVVACALLALATCALAPSLRADPPPTDSPAIGGSFFESQIDPNAESNFSLAQFRLWIPESKTPVKGVLAVLPGSDSDGLPLASDPHWQAIAAKWKYALLAITFTTSSSAPPYYRAECGSGQALLSALDQIAVESGHSEIAVVPVAILGHSQGGQLAVHFACWQPSRVTVFAAIKGGYYQVTPTDAAKAVPGLLITASKDAEFRQKNIRALYDRNSTPNARWVFASEPGAGHELGRSLQLVIPFFDAVINGNLEPYSADLETLNVSPAASTGESGHPWLPNRDVAQIWTRFVNGAIPESKPDLQIPRNQPPPTAQVSGSADLGSLDGLGPPASAVFHLKVLPAGPQWTSIRAFSLHSRSELSVSPSAGEWIVSVRPLLDQLPLGRISDTIYVCYLNDGHPILGATELSLTFNHTSPDITLSSPSLYFGVHSLRDEKTITITSNAGKPLKIRSLELSKGTDVELSSAQVNATSASITVALPPLPVSGNHSGIISVHLDQPMNATIIIPFIGFYRSPDPATNAPPDPPK